jgi:hypothetical protein
MYSTESKKKNFSMSTPAEILVNLLALSRNEGKGDLNPDDINCFCNGSGLSLSLVIKHLDSKKERELGTIGLKLGLF